MSLTNYQDLSKVGASVNAGFQFEFYCGHCSRQWKSPYAPYRRGRLAGMIYKYGYFLPGFGKIVRVLSFASETGEKHARETALQEAIALAEPRYNECRSCQKAVCEDCWNPRTQRCEGCSGKGEQPSAERGSQAAASGGGNAGVGLACPNCRAAFGGGRFCAECGFDMASTHKSCPGCGTMCARAARFCPDCGHGF
jgi:hypothetical protein